MLVSTDYEWYLERWKSRETPQFTDWWISYYGEPDIYDMTDIGEVNEYWVRRAFALMGWLARIDNERR
jgi:hypothetical protein